MVTPSDTSVQFEKPGISTILDGEPDIRLGVISGINSWSIYYQSSELSGPDGAEIMPSDVLMQSAYTGGYQSLDIPRLVAVGGNLPQPTEVARLKFRVVASNNLPPGEYKGFIYSTNQNAPTIDVVVKVLSFISLDLSPGATHFSVDGLPQIYESRPDVTMQVSTNQGWWQIKGKAEDMNPVDGISDPIPASRLFVATDPQRNSLVEEGAGPGFRPLDEFVLLAEGYGSVVNLSSKLMFRLKTAWTDKPGDYSGYIVFLLLARP